MEVTAQFLARLSHQWFPAVLALPVVCGAAAYCVQRWPMRTRGDANAPERRFSFVTRVLLYVPLMASLLVCVVAFSHLGCAMLVGQQAQCLSNMKQLSIGIAMYAQDYDERLPAATGWADSIDAKLREAAASNGSAGKNLFHCPTAETPAGYGMNVLAGGAAISEVDAPANTVLLFEANAPIRSFAGSAGDVARERHSGASNIAFTDGHAKRVNAYVWKELLWTPTQALFRK